MSLFHSATADRKETLDWVNKIRVDFAIPPLAELSQGRRRSASSCPVARSLQGHNAVGRVDAVSVQTDSYLINHDDDDPGWITLPHPPAVQRFISRFDHGRYKDLIENG